jgi:hypothetical protein
MCRFMMNHQYSCLTLVIALGIATAMMLTVENNPQAMAKLTNSNTVCIDDQPCRTEISNSTGGTQNSRYSSSNMKTVCIDDQPCRTEISH